MKDSISQSETPHAAIIGSDLILAALPAEPVQVVNACLALGFDFVVPASWGDEVIASGVVDELALRSAGTAILCSCPRARARLTEAGNDLSPFLVQTVAPPVAAARYLRTLNGDSPLRVTYIGACPGAQDDSIDERLTVHQFLELCSRRSVLPLGQANVFESVIPTDRRRHLSLPGGVPTRESLAASRPGTELHTVDTGALAFDVAQSIVSGRVALLDMSASVHCACSGFGDPAVQAGRQKLVALEPPRSSTPVVDTRILVDIDLPAQTPVATIFDEGVPLSVVVGADMGYVETEIPSAIRALVQHADVVAPEMQELEPQEILHDDIGATATVPALRVHAGPSAELQSEQDSGVVTRPHRTPAAPLPRAYLMMRRLRASGEHAALSQGGTPSAGVPKLSRAAAQVTDHTGAPPRGADTPHANSARPSRSDATPVPAMRSSPAPTQGTVDTVLDLLTKAIRDVVEPR